MGANSFLTRRHKTIVCTLYHSSLSSDNRREHHSLSYSHIAQATTPPTSPATPLVLVERRRASEPTPHRYLYLRAPSISSSEEWANQEPTAHVAPNAACGTCGKLSKLFETKANTKWNSKVRKKSTPFDRYYLSVKWMYLDGGSSKDNGFKKVIWRS